MNKKNGRENKILNSTYSAEIGESNEMTSKYLLKYHLEASNECMTHFIKIDHEFYHKIEVLYRFNRQSVCNWGDAIVIKDHDLFYIAFESQDMNYFYDMQKFEADLDKEDESESKTHAKELLKQYFM